MEQPNNVGAPPQAQRDLLDQMVAEAVDYIHGKARTQVVEQLRNSTNTSETIAAITYKVSRGIIERHKQDGMAMDIGMDFAVGLAAEIIDMQIEMMERINPGFAENSNMQRVREDAMMRAITLHGEQVEDTPENREEASVMLRGMMQDGTADKAFGYVNNRADQDGLNVDDMMRRGNEQTTGQRKPLTGAIRAGLNPAPAPLMGDNNG